MNSAIKYLTSAVFTVGLGATCGRIYVISSCRFTFIMYHAATASVFLLTLMIYMHLLYFRCTVCVYTCKLHICRNYDMTVLFSCHRTCMGGWFSVVLTTRCGHYGYTIYVEELLSFCLCLSRPSSRLSLCTDFLCVSVCSRQDLSLICIVVGHSSTLCQCMCVCI